MIRRYRSFRSLVANRPPSSCTIGRSSGGITGTTSRIIHSGRDLLLMNASTISSRLMARARRGQPLGELPLGGLLLLRCERDDLGNRFRRLLGIGLCVVLCLGRLLVLLGLRRRGRKRCVAIQDGELFVELPGELALQPLDRL